MSDEESMKQFDLEQSIMDCWDITEDLDTLLEAVIEHPDFDKDKISNVLMGVTELYNLKFDKCFRNFEAFLKDYYELRNRLEEIESDKGGYIRGYRASGENRPPVNFDDDLDDIDLEQ
jgi:hypothetical protein